MKAESLAGRGIVITRPREHAANLAELVRAAGGDPVLFPTIEIAPPQDPGRAERIIAGLHRFHLAIFISPTAAVRGLEMVNAVRAWPTNLRVAAVGSGTVRALAEQGIRAVLSPVDRADSEALAALPELTEVRSQSIVIFRGQGGREWLRSELESRGARVEYAECYRRMRPRADARGLLERWQLGGVDAVSVTSTEGLENLFEMLGASGSNSLRATPVFVPHGRIGVAAEGRGVRTVVVTGRGDEQTVAGMAAFFARV